MGLGARLPIWLERIERELAGRRSRSRLIAGWFLRAGVAAACAGSSWMALVHGSAFRMVLDRVPFLTAHTAGAMDRAAGVALLVLALLVLARPNRGVLGAVAAWFAVLAVGTTLRAEPFWYLEPGAAAIRLLAPIALMLFIEQPDRAGSAMRVMRVAVALTFATYGVEALGRAPSFASLIEGSAQNLLGLTPAPYVVDVSLTMIGALNVFMALLVFGGGVCRGPLGYMAVWGAVTAFSSVTAQGLGAWHEALIQLPHSTVPVAALLLIGTTPEARAPARARPRLVEIQIS